MRARVALALVVLAGCGGTNVETRITAPQIVSLPTQGIALRQPGSVWLVGLDGRVHAKLHGFRIDESGSTQERPQRLVYLRGRGASWLVDRHGVRRVAHPKPLVVLTANGCRSGSDPYAICGRPYDEERRRPSTVELDGRVLVKAVSEHGHWRRVERSPDGTTLLLQWSGACEIPTAFFASTSGARLRTVTGESYGEAPESEGLGWAADGRAVVALYRGVCGRGHDAPGTYLIDPATGERTLVFRARGMPRYGFGPLWGG